MGMNASRIRTVTTNQRRELCAARVTLNGQPATIAGIQCDYARVTDQRSGLSCEWAWPTVARVVANGGRFESWTADDIRTARLAELARDQLPADDYARLLQQAKDGDS
jgi:hypothetical protein